MRTRRSTIHKPEIHTNFAQAAVQIFAANERMNQLVIEHLDPAAWRPKSAKPLGNVRTIAAIFTHMHNVRCKWVRLSAPHLKIPAQLNRTQCTPEQALDGKGRIKEFLRDGWAKPWPPGPEMLCYMLAHEAHHRGQVFMLAHQLGFPLPHEVMYGLWNWDNLWKECGFPRGPGKNI